MRIFLKYGSCTCLLRERTLHSSWYFWVTFIQYTYIYIYFALNLCQWSGSSESATNCFPLPKWPQTLMLFESLFLLFSCWLVFLFVCFLVNILVSSSPFSALTNSQFPSVADQVCRLGVAEQLSGFKHRAFTAAHMALCALALVGSPHICVQLWAVISASSLTFGFSWFRMTSTGTLGLCHMASQPPAG